MAANCAPWLSHCCQRLWGCHDGLKRGGMESWDSSSGMARPSQDGGLEERLVVSSSSRASSLDFQERPIVNNRMQVSSMPVMLLPPTVNAMPSTAPHANTTTLQGPGSWAAPAATHGALPANNGALLAQPNDSNSAACHGSQALIPASQVQGPASKGQGGHGSTWHAGTGVFKRLHFGWGGGVGPPALSSSSPAQLTQHPWPSKQQQQQQYVGGSGSFVERLRAGRSTSIMVHKGLGRQSASDVPAQESIEVELKEGQAGPGLGVGYLEEGGRAAFVQARI